MTSNKCLTSFFIMFIVYLSFLEGVFKGARNLYSPRTELDIWEMLTHICWIKKQNQRYFLKFHFSLLTFMKDLH